MLTQIKHLQHFHFFLLLSVIALTTLQSWVFFYFLVLTVAIKKRSRVPGVMITQFVEQLPAGKSTPDFMRKPMSTTVQEGKQQTYTVKLWLLHNIKHHIRIYHCFIGLCTLIFQVKKHFSKLQLVESLHQLWRGRVIRAKLMIKRSSKPDMMKEVKSTFLRWENSI